MSQAAKSIAVMLAVVASVGAADGLAQTAAGFSPAKGMHAALTVSGQKVELHLAGPGVKVAETFVVDTERTLRVSVEDFNFDGHKDFSISHFDDGMGTYEISLVYVYSPKRRAFLPLAPRCGDEFINLKVNKSRKTLANSYLVDNRYRTCDWSY